MSALLELLLPLLDPFECELPPPLLEPLGPEGEGLGGEGHCEVTLRSICVPSGQVNRLLGAGCGGVGCGGGTSCTQIPFGGTTLPSGHNVGCG